MKCFLNFKKTIFPSVLTVTALLLFAGMAEADFNRNLKLGDSGEDVRKLQQVLNQNPLTRVAVGGPGSPGLETSYFGPRTYEAVVRFQDIYRTEVLTPAGLFLATGYVGPFSRAKLNEVASQPRMAGFSVGPKSTSVVPREENVVRDEGKGHPNNYEYLDEHIAKIRELGREHGQSEEELNAVEREIRKMAESPKDLRKEFYDKATEAMRQANSPWRSFLTNLIKPFAPSAYALTDLPFGGQIQSTITCTCTSNYINVYVGSPTSVTADYQYGTQMYLNYNFPTGTWGLGLYTPSGTGACEIIVSGSCSPVYSQGVVTGTVGSSQ